jgi:hypothetical protein
MEEQNIRMAVCRQELENVSRNETNQSTQPTIKENEHENSDGINFAR